MSLARKYLERPMWVPASKNEVLPLTEPVTYAEAGGRGGVGVGRGRCGAGGGQAWSGGRMAGEALHSV